MAEVPNAELVCRWQEWQWQIYSARGFGVGVLNLTAPHWQLASILLVVPQRQILESETKDGRYPVLGSQLGQLVPTERQRRSGR